MQIDGNTKLVALLGHPVEHTRSPLIHNTAFEYQGLNYRYVAFSVAPEDFPAALEGLTAMGFLGANVTIPHKEAALERMVEVSPQAAAVGAVNTIILRNIDGSRTLRGENTDIHGFLTPLSPYVEEVRKKPVLVFGCGGSARAVAYGIASVVRPPALVLAVRNVEKGERLLAEVVPDEPGRPELHVIPMNEAGRWIEQSSLVVNCTPLGMSPEEDATPWEDASVFGEQHVVYDLIYNPMETRLLRMAAEQGATCINGLEMLIQQASASYRLWTGWQMPVDQVREALLRNPD